MATAVVMPKQGQSVESCIIVDWKKKVGDVVAVGEALCDVETDKTTMEVPSPVAGTLLALFFAPGADVPVMTNIAAIGTPGEDVGALNPNQSSVMAETEKVAPPASPVSTTTLPTLPSQPATAHSVSPRARQLAEQQGIDVRGLQGSGPEGRIIERDVEAAARSLAAQPKPAQPPSTTPKLTPIAKAMLAEGGYALPDQGSGPGGRVTSRDLVASAEVGMRSAELVIPHPLIPSSPHPLIPAQLDEITTIPVKGVRKVIAERMLASLQTTAQLTMNTSADARALRALRERLKNSPEGMGLRGVSINDLLLFAVSRTLPQHPFMNALFADNTIAQYKRVHLGFAVDTPRGLIVPVIRNADTLTLKQIASESKRLSAACLENKISADELNGGTFTVSNLGNLGIETFTPVLNPPQVGILGVGGIALKAVEGATGVEHIPHLSLSLTINHQVVDGAPAARFLQTLVLGISQVDLLMAI